MGLVIVQGTFNGDLTWESKIQKKKLSWDHGMYNQLVIKHGSVGHRKGGFLLGVFHCHV